MGYWEEKAQYELQKSKPVKCPKNKNVEVIWKPSKWTGFLICSFSGMDNCKKCIEKGKYPK